MLRAAHEERQPHLGPRFIGLVVALVQSALHPVQAGQVPSSNVRLETLGRSAALYCFCIPARSDWDRKKLATALQEGDRFLRPPPPAPVLSPPPSLSSQKKEADIMSLAGLYSPPEQAGYLLKKGHSRHSWKERYFILKVKTQLHCLETPGWAGPLPSQCNLPAYLPRPCRAPTSSSSLTARTRSRPASCMGSSRWRGPRSRYGVLFNEGRRDCDAAPARVWPWPVRALKRLAKTAQC